MRNSLFVLVPIRLGHVTCILSRTLMFQRTDAFCSLSLSDKWVKHRSGLDLTTWLTDGLKWAIRRSHQRRNRMMMWLIVGISYGTAVWVNCTEHPPLEQSNPTYTLLWLKQYDLITVHNTSVNCNKNEANICFSFISVVRPAGRKKNCFRRVDWNCTIEQQSCWNPHTEESSKSATAQCGANCGASSWIFSDFHVQLLSFARHDDAYSIGKAESASGAIKAKSW